MPFVALAVVPKENVLLDCDDGAGTAASPPVVDCAAAAPEPLAPNPNPPLVAVLGTAAPVKENPPCGAGALLLLPNAKPLAAGAFAGAGALLPKTKPPAAGAFVGAAGALPKTKPFAGAAAVLLLLVVVVVAVAAPN